MIPLLEPGQAKGPTAVALGSFDGLHPGHRSVIAAVTDRAGQRGLVPTVDPTAPSAVEVHLLGRSLDLNGKELLVEPVELLRRQQRFENLEALVQQIQRDAERAAALLDSAAGVGVG